ncbi:MAG: hypothetical protein M0D55_06670 [Elusimicrobiota bacterium]|nr:MAG: hypothetical protein M0D55_06670 [Elusimicrobiota bacterium]
MQREHRVEASDPFQQVLRLHGKELAAELLAREAVALEQHRPSAGPREEGGQGASGRSAADDRHGAALG